MSKTILALTLMSILISYSADQPKKYVIKEETAVLIHNNISGVKDYITKSNLPQQEANALIKALTDADNAMIKDVNDSTLNPIKKP